MGALTLFGCAPLGTEERPLPPEPRVTVSYSAYPSVDFAGSVIIHVTSIPFGGDEGRVRLILNSESTGAGGTLLSFDLTVDLDSARRLVAGETLTSGLGELFTPELHEVHNNLEAFPDPAAWPQAPEIASLELTLDGTMFELRAVADQEVLVARGQFVVGCALSDDGSITEDGRWESPFCSSNRATLGLGPWIAAAE